MLVTLLRVFVLFVGLCVACYTSSEPQKALQWVSLSEAKHFKVTIYPQDNRTIIGDYHHWIVELADHEGMPIGDAQIAIGGGMEGHGHGLPSQPEVTRYLGDGRYLIEGVLFNMAGEWALLMAIQTATASDRVRVDMTLTF